MAKEITGFVKLQVKGGQANPAPPVGPALGSKGINIMEFCKQFNARTQDKMGKVLPVLITVYSDKSFEFVIKTPPAAVQLLEATKLQSGSKEPNRSKVGKVTWLPRRKMFVQSLHFSAATAKSVITPPRRIVVTTQIVSSSASFVRVAESIQCTAKRSSL